MNLLNERVTSIEVSESAESLVSLPDSDLRMVLDKKVDLGYSNEFLSRESVALRLIRASRLLPDGISLSIKETYRPLAFQEKIFNRRLNRLSELPENHDKTESALHELVARFIAPPNVAGHPTGGAVDVSLIDIHGNELDMGCGYDEDEITSSGRCFSFCDDLPEQIVLNRSILFRCMEKSGFVNYPYEWWHWSFGDKYWAAVSGVPYAIYDSISRN